MMNPLLLADMASREHAARQCRALVNGERCRALAVAAAAALEPAAPAPARRPRHDGPRAVRPAWWAGLTRSRAHPPAVPVGGPCANDR